MAKLPHFYIWSYEHRMWWNPNERGYTPNLKAAGLYNQDTAEKIVEQGRGNEIAFPSDETITFYKRLTN